MRTKNLHGADDQLWHEISVSSLLALPCLASLVKGCLSVSESDLWR